MVDTKIWSERCYGSCVVASRPRVTVIKAIQIRSSPQKRLGNSVEKERGKRLMKSFSSTLQVEDIVEMVVFVQLGEKSFICIAGKPSVPGS
jgi:hypothetical protein